MTETQSQKQLPGEENHITTIQEFVAINNDETNSKLLSLFFIWKKDEAVSEEENINVQRESNSIAKKKEINKYYLANFTLKSKKEAQDLVRHKNARFSGRNHNADFFVHDEKTRKLIPFKKNDYLMYDNGYITFDGKSYIFYDNNGNEKRISSYLDNPDV